MVLIKRYPNRKLYNTETKQYITLERIAELIRQGEEVQVIDYASGEDLTAHTLTQIILEQEKNQSGLLSNTILVSLIRSSGDRIAAFQRGLRSPFTFLQHIDQEIQLRVQELIRVGELSEKQGKELLEKLLRHPSQPAESSLLDKEVSKLLARNQIPTQSDLQKLNEQLDELTQKLAELVGSE